MEWMEWNAKWCHGMELEGNPVQSDKARLEWPQGYTVETFDLDRSSWWSTRPESQHGLLDFPSMAFQGFPLWSIKNPTMGDQNPTMAVHPQHVLGFARNGRRVTGYIYIYGYILCMDMFVCNVCVCVSLSLSVSLSPSPSDQVWPSQYMYIEINPNIIQYICSYCSSMNISI